MEEPQKLNKPAVGLGIVLTAAIMIAVGVFMAEDYAPWITLPAMIVPAFIGTIAAILIGKMKMPPYQAVWFIAAPGTWLGIFVAFTILGKSVIDAIMMSVIFGTILGGIGGYIASSLGSKLVK